MDKRESITKSIELWTELARSGGDSKSAAMNTLGWEKAYLSNCPLCEYVKSTAIEHATVMNCTKCPMYGHWSEGRSTLCYKGDTLYNLWLNEDAPFKRVDLATNIVNKLKELI